MPCSSAAVTNLPAALAAGTSLFKIVDHQGLCVDATFARTDDFTPVILWDCNTNIQQKWRFTPTQPGAASIVYSISAAFDNSSILSVPAVDKTSPPNPDLGNQQTTLRKNSTMTWQLVPNLQSGQVLFNFVENVYGVSAITSWPAASSSVPLAPLLLIGTDPTLATQGFCIEPADTSSPTDSLS